MVVEAVARAFSGIESVLLQRLESSRLGRRLRVSEIISGADPVSCIRYPPSNFSNTDKNAQGVCSSQSLSFTSFADW
jgi:hypothetical protein